ncbi:MAG: hypothetical protein ACRDF0_10250 [Candidatus Limnocylindria bacterium]
MTRARLSFPQGEPIEFALEDIVAYGPAVTSFIAWLGAVFAAADGRWAIRFEDDRLLGFRRSELRRIRLSGSGAELTLGSADEERTLSVREEDVRSYGPEPDDLRSWLGRLAHGRGEAWLRFADGRELRFRIGDGPHVALLEPASPDATGGSPPV